MPQQIFFAEAKAHFDAAITAEIGFVERLVWFWSNHFCVNADDTVMAGGYEREAIRPHVLGHFVELLQAAEGHPAMLLYLTNTLSMGPNSVAGINRTRGLNENLAREILELHTLGVRTGYTQEDVTSFAKVITGWTILPTDTNPDHGGEFLFHRRLHEPGPQTVIGKSYRDTGFEQGRAVLADLARHPATARHIATKLARHFVADDPPPALVARLAQRFNETEGDLWEVSKALVTAPESWSEERVKIKRPSEWMVAVSARGAVHRRHPRHRPGHEPAGRAAVAAAGAARLSRRQRHLARRAVSPARHRQQFRPAQWRPARRGGDAGYRARAARLRGDAPRRRPRGNASPRR